MRRRRRGLRRLRRSGLLAIGLALGATIAFGSPAGAVSGTATGYWSMTPASPGVPAKGMWVASAPAGPVAVAALRLDLDQGEAPPVVVSLKVDQVVPPGGASIFACPTTKAWNPVEGGSFADVPTYDCSKGRVVGTLSSDGTRLVFDASPLVTTKGLDITLIPTPASNPVPAAVPVEPPPSSSSFSATFQPFTVDQVSVLSAPVVPAAGSGAAPASPPAQRVTASAGVAAAVPTAVVSRPAIAPVMAAGASATPGSEAAPQVVAPIALSVPSALTDAVGGVSTRVRVILGFALLALLAWEMVEGAVGEAGRAARPRLALGDVPPMPATTPLREGKPPPLR